MKIKRLYVCEVCGRYFVREDPGHEAACLKLKAQAAAKQAIEDAKWEVAEAGQELRLVQSGRAAWVRGGDPCVAG